MLLRHAIISFALRRFFAIIDASLSFAAFATPSLMLFLMLCFSPFDAAAYFRLLMGMLLLTLFLRCHARLRRLLLLIFRRATAVDMMPPLLCFAKIFAIDMLTLIAACRQRHA